MNSKKAKQMRLFIKAVSVGVPESEQEKTYKKLKAMYKSGKIKKAPRLGG